MTTLHAVHLPCDEDPADTKPAIEPRWDSEALVTLFADARAPIHATWRRTREGADYLDLSIAGVSVALSVGALGNLGDAIATARKAGAR